MTHRRGRGAALLAAVALGVTACGSPAAPGVVSAPLPKSDVAGILTGRTPGHIVVLGDSYSSGEGAGDYETGAAESCRRSRATYLANALSPAEGSGITALAPGSTVDVLACSGADMTDIDEQLSDPRAADPSTPIDLVVLTIGGNDIGFGDLATDCALSGALLGDEAQSGTCRDRHADVPSTITGRMDDLTATYERVRAAIGAPLVVLPYVDPLPPEGSDVTGCILGPDTAQFAREVLSTLNDTISRAVQRAGDGVSLATDVEGAFPGHDLCSADPWIHGADAVESFRSAQDGGAGDLGPLQEAGHPTRAGYEAITRALQAWAAGQTH